MEDIHKCNKEAEISEMLVLIKTLTKQVYGNGQKGIAFMIPELITQINAMSVDVQDLSTSVSALMKFMASYEGAKIQKEKDRFSNRQKTSIIVSGILGGTAILVTIILKFI